MHVMDETILIKFWFGFFFMSARLRASETSIVFADKYFKSKSYFCKLAKTSEYVADN